MSVKDGPLKVALGMVQSREGWKSVSPSNVPYLLKEVGILTIYAHVFGGDLVLLLPSEGEVVLEVLEDADVRVRCVGVPLCAWNVALFEQIANEMGSLLGLDDMSRNRLSFEFCRMRIITTIKSRLDRELIVAIDEKEFIIGEVERGRMIVSDSLVSSEDLLENIVAWISNSLEKEWRMKEVVDDGAGLGALEERDEVNGINEGCLPKLEILNPHLLGLIEAARDHLGEKDFLAIQSLHVRSVSLNLITNDEVVGGSMCDGFADGMNKIDLFLVGEGHVY
ncbi:unnamed protein product [Lupinus luteus]|uniref:Uncharacterized protein n=1 Tax=Lupinus luteus TaxID=3873 RepID=A0AAV1W2D7_LUPLU